MVGAGSLTKQVFVIHLQMKKLNMQTHVYTKFDVTASKANSEDYDTKLLTYLQFVGITKVLCF